MQTQPKHAVRTTQLKPASARREQRGNVIQWRAEALRRRQPSPDTRTLPAAPGESGSPLVSERVQSLILLLVAIATVVVIAARVGGVL